MALSWRSFEDADYRLRADQFVRISPEFPESEDDLRAHDAAFPESAKRRQYVFERDGQYAGYAEWFEPPWFAQAGRVQFSMQIEPDDPDRETVIRFLIEDAAKAGANEFWAPAKTSRIASLEVLRRMGFDEVERAEHTLLDLERIDEAVYRAWIDRARVQGFEITSYAELSRQGADWLRPLHRAVDEMVRDIPTESDVTPADFETFERMITDPVLVDRELMFGAFLEGAPVSFTRIECSLADPTRARTAFSGTVRQHRGKGLVTAVKAACLLAAKAKGVCSVLTDNLENNPMLGINKRMGFETAFHVAFFRLRR